jgi:ribonuclease R
MLAANQFVARTLAAARAPLLWRVHEPPTGSKAEELRVFLKKLGIVWSVGDPPDNADYQRLLHAIQRRPEQRYLMYKVLRSLQKARYEARQQGHFGLAFSHYTHFTSPIRRYPDLYIHRLVRRTLRGAAQLATDPARHGPALHALGVHTSAREMAAAEAERASLKLKVCEFLAGRLGDVESGFVSSVTEHGLYVDVPAWRAEGLVHSSLFSDDDYRADPHGTRLTGQRTRRTYRFGQELRVQLVRSDPDRRQIDLALAG